MVRERSQIQAASWVVSAGAQEDAEIICGALRKWSAHRGHRPRRALRGVKRTTHERRVKTRVTPSTPLPPWPLASSPTFSPTMPRPVPKPTPSEGLYSSGDE